MTTYNRYDSQGVFYECTSKEVPGGFDITEVSNDGKKREIKKRYHGSLQEALNNPSSDCNCVIATFSEVEQNVPIGSFTVETCPNSPCATRRIDSDGNEIFEGCGISLDYNSGLNASIDIFVKDCMIRLSEGYYDNQLYDGACGNYTRYEMAPEERA